MNVFGGITGSAVWIGSFDPVEMIDSANSTIMFHQSDVLRFEF